MRYNKTRKAVIFWCVFIGIGAVCGAIGLLSDPTYFIDKKTLK